jgi:hypothetical protein
MYFLYKNEYRIFKPVKITIGKGTKVEKISIFNVSQVVLM